ncbi:MAG TPA: alpha/beta hydrolase [bacterium]|nr:alpha/beta hydrolase [bacterium]
MKKMVFSLFLSLLLTILGCGYTSNNTITSDTHHDCNCMADISRSVILVELPGIFNRASSFYSGLFHIYFTDRNYECVPIDLPYRDVPFSKVPAMELGKITLQDDAFFLVGRINYIKGKYPNSKIVLVGHSRGGLLAQMVAAELGDGIDAMILLCPAPPSGISSLSFSGVLTFAGLMKNGLSWRDTPIARTFEATCYGVLDDEMPKEEALAVHRGLVWESGQTFWQLVFDKPEVDDSKITCPILVIGGEKDRLISPSTAKKVADKYGADFALFNTAHYPFYKYEGREAVHFIDCWLKEKLAL